MPNLNEVINSLNDETTVAEAREILQEAANAEIKKNSQLYHRAKKAEGFEYDKGTGKYIKKEIDKKSDAQTEKLGDVDYGKQTFIASVLGVKIKDEGEMKIVNEYLGNGKKLEDLVDNKHFLNDLKDFRDTKSVEEAMPTGSKRSAPSLAQNSVEYWINKGELPPAEQVQLRRDVVNAKYNAQKNISPFKK